MGDYDYRKWLTRMPTLPAETVKPWLVSLVAKADGNLSDVSRWSGMDHTSISKVLAGTKQSVTMEVAERVANASGHWGEFVEAQPRIGREGWSELGWYCGDGAEALGCGTFHHKHSEAGLCEECWMREEWGLGPSEPRDVRFSREVLDGAVRS